MALTARCTERGLLEVEVEGDYDAGFGDDLHIHDYGLFYMDIRAGAARRADAFLAGGG